MIKESMTIPVDGGAMPGYVARPDEGAAVPAVIVLQEIFGVNAEVKRITELVAAMGYVGIAINYYHRTAPELNEPYTQEGLQNGFKVAATVNRATFAADLRATIDWLNAQSFVKFGHIATWGFCFGGSVAFFSSMLEGLSAAIAFYGGSIASGFPSGEPELLADAADVKAPLLLVFGGRDAYIPPEAVERIKTTLEAKAKRFQLQVYPDQDHAFFRESTAAMDRRDGDATGKAIADAADLVRAFLGEHLS